MWIALWVLFGLAVGVIAKLLSPGRDLLGFARLALLGAAGALLGGFLGQLIGLYPSYQAAGGYFMALVGAMLTLAVYNSVSARPA